MPHYIKTGFWALEKNGYKGWLNLEDIVGGGGGSTIVSVTKAEVDALISANSLVPGQFYEISGVDVPLYGGTTILIQAATTNKLALAGHGIFYNPKYLINGSNIWQDYVKNVLLTNIPFGESYYYYTELTADNGATGYYFTNGLIQWLSGDWSTATTVTGGYSLTTATVSGFGVANPTYNIGDNVIWGGKHWVNTSGNLGTAVDIYTLSGADWTVIPFNDVDYNVVVDIIHYDYEHDLIIRRKDKWDNDVDFTYNFLEIGYGHPIKGFQWGNYPDSIYTGRGIYSNYVKDSYLGCINFTGFKLCQNTLTQESQMDGNIGEGSIYRNTLSARSYILDNSFSGNISEILDNVLNNFSGIEGNALHQCIIARNTINDEAGIYYNNLDNGGLFYYTGIIDNILNQKTYIDENTLTVLSQPSYISRNVMNSGGIEYNFLQSGLIDSNVLNTSAGATYSGVSIDSNYLNNSSIYGNTLSNFSTISGNEVTSTDIYENELFGESDIFANTGASLSISWNYLSGQARIGYNNLTLGYPRIQYNTLNTGSEIYNNSGSGCEIKYNTLTSQSKITNNIFSGGNISYNNLSNLSSIQENTITSNTTIRRNDLQYSSFTSNVLQLCTVESNILNTSSFDFSASGTLTSKNISFIEASGNANLSGNISAATVIYGNYSKVAFKRLDGTVQLGYYNNSNVFVAGNVTA